MQAKREWQDIFKVIKGGKKENKITVLARVSFKIDGEIKKFQTSKS